MSTVILPKSRFLHVPKTGGSWITRALTRATPRHLLFEAHLSYDRAPGKELISFIAVRRPEGYYRSFWAYRMRNGWTDHPLDCCRADDFREFIANVLDYNPSFYSELLARKFYDPAGTILLSFDDLEQQLIDTLKLIGEEFSEEAIRTTGRANTSDYKKYTAVWDESQKAEIIAANSFAVELCEKSQVPQELPHPPREAPLLQPSRARRFFGFWSDYWKIRTSRQFDRDYYVGQGKLSSRQRRFPLLHFVYRGEQDGMKPNPDFQLLDYIDANPGAVWESRNLFAHYLRHQNATRG